MEPGLHHHILSCMGLKDEREVLLSEIGLEGLSLELLLNEVVRSRVGAFALFKFWKTAEEKGRLYTCHDAQSTKLIIHQSILKRTEMDKNTKYESEESTYQKQDTQKHKRLRNAQCWRLSDWLTNHDRSGKIYSGIYRDEELMPGEKKDKKKGVEERSYMVYSSKLLSQEVGLLLITDAGVLLGRFYKVLRTSVSCFAPAFPHRAAVGFDAGLSLVHVVQAMIMDLRERPLLIIKQLEEHELMEFVGGERAALRPHVAFSCPICGLFINSVLDILIEEYNKRFSDFEKHVLTLKLTFEPHLVDIDVAPKEYQMELFEIGDDIFKSQFDLKKDPIEIWKTAVIYPRLRQHARRILSCFGSTYCCEATFSYMT
ncbi:hypothetical protein LAZ67_X000090 [Cordylochernes scorpioides]|uniref:Uncharacterized protein n=1 Tax=Cordylochernes scorpioides TaxID=51811 RepID=A0ABY6LRD9_9ARAC|nr:hypothetical protein LAZ67_X000090 [Cordylochernes scorpioides]